MNDLFDYDNESTSTVFRDVIFLALMGFMAIVILLLPFINPPQKEDLEEKIPPGNIIIEMFWDNSINVDIDLWLQGPGDNVVGYSSLGGKLFNLLRDDLGFSSDISEQNYEVAFSRGVVGGEYTVNVMYYANRYTGETSDAYSSGLDSLEYRSRPQQPTRSKKIIEKVPVPPIIVTIVISIKANSKAKAVKVLNKKVELWRVSEEITVFNFTIDEENKKVIRDSVNDIYRPLASKR